MDIQSVTQWFYIRPVILAISAILLFISWHRRPKNLPPGPWRWPVFGSFPNLIFTAWRTGRTKPHKLLEYLAKQYGGVFSMYLGNQLVVVLNTHDAIREAFQNPDISSRPVDKMRKKLKLGQGVAVSSGETWHQQRKFTMRTFSSFGIGKSHFQDQIAEEAEALVREFNKFEGKTFDPKMLVANATANIICSVIFGKRYEYSDDDFQRLLWMNSRRLELSGSGGLVKLFIPVFQYLQPNVEKELTQLTIEQRTFIQGIISEHKKAFDPDNLRDYIDVYLNEIHQNRVSTVTSELNDLNMESSVISLFRAGSETTSNTLRWILLYLIAYPEIQSRLHKEIDDVVGQDRLPRLADKTHMPHLQATIHEAQRSLGVLGFPHATSADTVVKGYSILKGSIVVANMFKVNHDPAVWEQPWVFRPERFIDENGAFCPSENVMPFSVGRRSCPGEGLAKMELFIFLTHLLHRFTFKKSEEEVLSLEPNVRGSSTPTDYKIQAIKRY